MCFTYVGSGQSIMAYVLAESMATTPPRMMCPRYST